MKAVENKLIVKLNKDGDFGDTLSALANELANGTVVYTGSTHIGVGAKVYFLQRAAKQFTNNGEILHALTVNDIFAFDDGEAQ